MILCLFLCQLHSMFFCLLFVFSSLSFYVSLSLSFFSFSFFLFLCLLLFFLISKFLSLFLCFSVSFSVSFSVCFSVWLSDSFSASFSLISLSVSLSVCVLGCLSFHWPGYPFIHLPLCLSIFVSFGWSGHFIKPSVYPLVCLSICLWYWLNFNHQFNQLDNLSFDKLDQNLGQLFNVRSDRSYIMRSCCYWAKLPSLKLKVLPKQLLGSVPLNTQLPQSGNRRLP